MIPQLRLNITDIALPASSSAPAAAAAPVEEVVVVKEKTVFNVSLTKIDAAQKAKAIREVKALMPTMNLVEVCLTILFLDRLSGADEGVGIG